MPGMYSRHWDTIIAALENGPIEDPSGLATEKLREITGHESTNALAKILRRMEQDGIIVRDINGRRTHRIALTREEQAKRRRPMAARTIVATEPEPAPAPSTNGDGGVDYDLLAAALLAKALKATQVQESAANVKELQARVERAEAARRIAEADAQAARAKVAELEAQVRTLEKNNQTLMAQMDKVRHAPQGTPVKDLISARELKDLDRLMRELPGVRTRS